MQKTKQMKLTYQEFDAEGFRNGFLFVLRSYGYSSNLIAAIKSYPNMLCQSQPHTEMKHWISGRQLTVSILGD